MTATAAYRVTRATPENASHSVTPERVLYPVTSAIPKSALYPVTPAKAPRRKCPWGAGVQGRRMGRLGRPYWTPAFAGVTGPSGVTSTSRITATLTTNLSKGHPAT
jgi:hypothetical protein